MQLLVGHVCSCLKPAKMLLKDWMMTWECQLTGFYEAPCHSMSKSRKFYRLHLNNSGNFWKAFDHFQNKTCQCGHFIGRSLTPNEIFLFVWTLFTSLHLCPWLWCLLFTSKRLGIGSVERSWLMGKLFNYGKQSNIGDSSLERKAVLFMSAKL